MRLMVSRKRQDNLSSASVAWPTKRASAFLALIGNNLHYVGCGVTENRRDGNHRDAAFIANGRRKLYRSVFDRIHIILEARTLLTHPFQRNASRRVPLAR